MNILVACEFSGAVRDAFRRRGHSAWSCDIVPSETSGHLHIQGDALDAIRDGRPTDGAAWDALIAFPPCTYICSSGMHWTKRGLRDPKLTETALDFVRALLDSKVAFIALENPVGAISSRIRKPDQIIQPWQFGHDASKKTCLWLKNLPPLKHVKIVAPGGYSRVKYASDCEPCPDCGEPYCEEHGEHYADCECIGPTQDEVFYQRIEGYEFAMRGESRVKPVWGNQTPDGQNRLYPSPNRAAERSRTYSGIADAMAAQWTAHIEQGAT